MPERRVGSKQLPVEGICFQPLTTSWRRKPGKHRSHPGAVAKQNPHGKQRHQLPERSEHQDEGEQAKEQRLGDP